MIYLTPKQIENWVSKNFEYKKRKNGEEILINNPFIFADSGFKFNISTVYKTSKKSGASGIWVHDWRPSANYNGSFIKFVQKYKNFTFREAIRDICGDNFDFKNIFKPQESKTKITTIENNEIELPELAVPITSKEHPKIKETIINYLKSRLITYEDALTYKIHYTPSNIIFPYIEYDSIVYWQGRSYLKGIKKFQFPTSSNKSNFLYGFDQAEPYSPVYITEAIIDSLTIGLGSLAVGGATISEQQARKLKIISPSIVILAIDNDQEGYASVYKNYKSLSNYLKLGFVVPPNPYKDWNEMACKLGNKDEIRKYVENYNELTLKEALKFRKLANNHDRNVKTYSNPQD